MSFVYKYKLPQTMEDEFELVLPRGARILHAAMQHSPERPYGALCLWALVTTSAIPVARKFIWRGTGHPIADGLNLDHVATVLLEGGALVFHLFEVLSDPAGASERTTPLEEEQASFHREVEARFDGGRQ